MIRGRIESLRKNMKEHGIDAYIIPSSDNHQSEYVGEFFKSRAYISGFTGSAGVLVVTMEEAGLWTDGRYFIQAESQLRDTGIKLFKMGEEGVPTTEGYIVNTMKENSVLGFDGRLISAKEGNDLKEKLRSKNVSIKYEYDLVDKVWEDRPSLSGEKAFLLNIKYAGETFSSKLKRLRDEMKLKGANVHVITTLDDIAWLFNIRGRDVKYTPVVLSYALITLDEVYLFINEDKLNEEIITELSKENVIIKPYDSIYEFVKSINLDEKILLDENKVSYSIYNNLPREVKKINEFNPTMNFKAVKNNIELENIRNSHLKDGVAFTKFMYWLKTNIGKIEISEISASEKLEELRREQEGFIEPSFATIAGYRDHAAMMH
ncbi:MAG: aminopeptidase P family N-terminal domain-containing protein, partial [Paeniclostridium sordellii]|nr:aminopeptidase P family N-terminal domain-containing protein [Paeniclostridium sordellii]